MVRLLFLSSNATGTKLNFFHCRSIIVERRKKEHDIEANIYTIKEHLIINSNSDECVWPRNLEKKVIEIYFSSIPVRMDCLENNEGGNSCCLLILCESTKLIYF